MIRFAVFATFLTALLSAGVQSGIAQEKGKDFEVKGAIAANDQLDPVLQKPAKTHTVKLTGGKTYQIDMVSADLDSYLRLDDSTGKTVAVDDDSGGNLNARIIHTAAKDDTFKIHAITFDGQFGNYVLTVKEITLAPVKVIAMKAPAAGQPSEHEGKIDLTDPKDAKLKVTPCKIHSIELKAGKTYVVDLISKNKDIDPFLRVEDNKNTELAYDDDGGEGLNSRLEFAPPADGTYRLVATTLKGVGEYTLRVTEK